MLTLSLQHVSCTIFPHLKTMLPLFNYGGTKSYGILGQISFRDQPEPKLLAKWPQDRLTRHSLTRFRMLMPPMNVELIQHFHSPYLPAAFCVVAHAIARTMAGRMKVIEKRDVPATGSQGGELKLFGVIASCITTQ